MPVVKLPGRRSEALQPQALQNERKYKKWNYLKLASTPELSESDREYYNLKVLIWEEILEGMEE